MAWKGAGLKVLRWFVWLLVAWVLLRGVVSFLPEGPQPAQPATAAPEEAKPAPEPAGLRSLAPMFAKEYLTFKAGGDLDRSTRLQPFLASGLDSQAGWTAGKAGFGQEVEGVWIHSVKQQSTTRWIVTVAARVAPYQDTTEPDATGTQRPVHKTFPVTTAYLAVPLAATENGGWVVAEYPALVTPPAKGAPVAESAPAQEISDKDDRVRTLATGFFRAYLSGSGDVSYFLAPDVKLPALQGSWSFDGVSRVTLYGGQEPSATVDVQVTDPVTGARFTYRYTLKLIERDSRWYIKDLLQKGE